MRTARTAGGLADSVPFARIASSQVGFGNTPSKTDTKTMYAIIKDGGRQFKVEVDKRLEIDYRGELEPGTIIEFTEVLAVGGEENIRIGQPTVAGAKVVAEVVSAVKGPKLVVAKFRRRKNSKRKTGHRQIYTLVKINEIVG